MWWSPSAPAALRPWWRAACANASRRCCLRASAISPPLSGAGESLFTRRIPEFPLRRRFWERVVDGPIGALVLAGRGDEAEAALKDIANPSAFAGAQGSGKAEGRVTLVGAGPGDPDLLTVKALRALQDADVVFYDELVSPEVLDRARRDAARIAVGRRVGKPGIGQDAINRLMIEAAKSGQRAVRLKGGDPFVFGRGGEEIEALRKAGVAYSVVPGITAGLGASAQFEVPLTFRHEALRITFLTAHKASDAETVDWSTLTDEKMTVVVYMGMTAAPSVRAGLLAAGRSPQTPVGVFARVTRPDAQAAVGTLDQLPDLVEQIDGGPAILIIGDVVAHSAPWRHSRLQPGDLRTAGCCRMTSPLEQKKIRITGPSVVTANRTWDGIVIYRTARQDWSADLSDAAIVRTSDEARALLAGIGRRRCRRGRRLHRAGRNQGKRQDQARQSARTYPVPGRHHRPSGSGIRPVSHVRI